MQLLIKRLIDIVLPSIAIILISPVLILIVILIKLDGGPILFNQLRLGYKGIPFKMFKFRSMIVNADNYLDASGKPTRDRITFAGKLLRKSSMDELPQLLNIIIGDMSLVGPRPTLVSHYELYSPVQKKRFMVKPGLTGLAQVSGRNDLQWSRRIEFDVEYVENFSLWLDFKILFKTIYVVLFAKGVALDRNAKMDGLNGK